MRTFLVLSFSAVVCLITGGRVFSQTVFINEFLASNSGILADEAGEFDDWVELYNAGTVPVNIGGMYLTDKLSTPKQWQIPTTEPAATTIPPGGFLLLWFDRQPSQGVLHVDAKLSADGEGIGLFASDGTQIDAISFGAQSTDVSYGRVTDGSPGFQFFISPTPGASNSGIQAGDRAALPTPSQPGGFYQSQLSITLDCTTPGAAIHYTLDGSVPTENSPLFVAPIPVSQTVVLRARAFAAGLLPSNVVSHTYLLNQKHTFPVVALSFEPADFFDPVTGIYPNYTADWERPVHVEFFEDDGSRAFSQEATAEIHGTASAVYLQKSLKLKAKADGGSGYFSYPIFPGLPLVDYKTLLLRNAGQDWNITMFRDAFVSSLVSDLSDMGNIIQAPRLFTQGFRPGVVYLNGEYWGILNLREHMSENYIEAHFGLKDSEIDLLENDNEARAGDFDRWNFLAAYLNANNFDSDANLHQLGAWLDLPHFLDYNLFNILIDNGDWPGNNYRRWRERKDNAQWRFLTFDLDMSFGLLDFEPDTVLWNTGDASGNALARALDASNILWPNPFWTTLPFRKTMENATYRRNFINRTADFLNVLFDPARVNARIDEFVTLYQPEIQRHFDRWNLGWFPWTDNVNVLRKFANERPQYMRQHMVDAFVEVTGTAAITWQVSPAKGGSIAFSTLNLTNDRLPWSGVYFTGVNIPAKAVPAPGFVFKNWSNPAMGSLPVAKVHLSQDETLVAFFQKGSTAKDPIVINEINFNSPDSPNSGDWVELFNPYDHPVDISGWVFEDESGGYFSLPANTVMEAGSYLVLVESVEAFAAVYPLTKNITGDFGEGMFGFKLSNGGELIQLKNADLALIDMVRYDDVAPWHPAADGQGASLQLVYWQLDNALPQSWKANSPTPGLPNQSAFQSQVIVFPPIGDMVYNTPTITLAATASSGLTVSFSLVSGPAILNGNKLTLTGQEGIVVIKASQQGNTIWQPAPDVFRSFYAKKPADYCAADGTRPWLEWIGRVQFGDIDHLSFKNRYGNFTHLNTQAPLGEKMTLRIVPAYSWEVFEQYFRAWIDFNQDGDFDDAGELVLEAHGTSAVSATVLIPSTATPGETRLRVAMQRDKYPQPCGQFVFGEVEDYAVKLSPDGSFTIPSQGQNQPHLSLAPNPASTMVGAHFSTKKAGQVQVTVINAAGVESYREVLFLQEGDHYIEVDVKELAEGQHSLGVQAKGQRAKVGVFVKINP
jgi:hypothetical protein